MAANDKIPESTRKAFNDRLLDRTVIAIPLLNIIQEQQGAYEEALKKTRRSAGKKNFAAPAAVAPPAPQEIIIDLNLRYPGGRAAARQWVLDNVQAAKQAVGVTDPSQGAHEEAGDNTGAATRLDNHEYVFATLAGGVIQKLVQLDGEHAAGLAADAAAKAKASPADSPMPRARLGISAFRAIYRVWPDFPVRACITHSVATIKVDAARNSYAALGRGITWAVMDTGIDKGHPHFSEVNKNLAVDDRFHRDFTVAPDVPGDPLRDDNGHGTHVAGIIAGQLAATPARPEIKAASRQLDEKGDPDAEMLTLSQISGMAPQCKLVSLKVLNGSAQGKSRDVIRAINHIQEINGNGREILIHGVNMSLGYDFDPEWFACGQSPLCVEVNRLVRSGVVVVVAAGNTGYGTLKTAEGPSAAGMSLTINDPGNADLAITVGSTHREMPHRYGVSYFSSKGPTGDGRLKPDLVAPGEKILSCATATFRFDENGQEIPDVLYSEHSGTSMAAPHVSGAIAAFLSIRREYVGEPEKVKEIFIDSATDLHREKYFQGAGLLDLMRAIQSV